jgi:hypothetical protein
MLLSAVAVGLLLAAWLLGDGATTAQDLLPTPRGQLGGAPSLQTAAPQPDESPPPTPEEDEPDVPDPSECQVGPRTIDELLAIAATPVAEDGPAVTPAATPPVIPVGEPADPIVANAVGYTVREAVACSNAGEIMRLWSLYSDDFIRRAAARLGGLDEGFLRSLVGPQPPRQDPMPAVLEVVLLPDGRAAARVVPVDARPVYALASAEGELVVLFVAVDGRWLVEDVRVVVA